MPLYTVSIQRRWFGEELKEKLGEYDHNPSHAELRELVAQHQLGGGATLYITGGSAKGAQTVIKARDLKE